MALHFSNFLDPPEPVRALSVHLLRAASEVSGPLPRWLEQQPLSAMSPTARQLAWFAGRRITGNPDHGFAMAAHVPADGVGSLWQLYQAAPTLAAIYELAPRLSLLLLDEVDLTITRGDHSVLLGATPISTARLDRAEEDFRAAMSVATWRALLDRPALAPLSVHFTYRRPLSTRCHEQQLGTHALRFSQPRFQLELACTHWEAPLPTADPARFERLRNEALEAVETMTQSSALDARVEALITQLLSRGTTAPKVARLLGMSVRTLHRQLAATGHGFRALVERAQQREAALIDETLELPGAPSLPLRVRARLLGFANPGALRNARKRWHDLTSE